MTKKQDDKEIDVFAAAIDAQRRMTAFTWQAGATLLEEAALFNRELLAFVQDRIREDVRTAEALGRCASVEEAIETLGAFQKKALDDYTEESARLSVMNAFAGDKVTDAAKKAA